MKTRFVLSLIAFCFFYLTSCRKTASVEPAGNLINSQRQASLSVQSNNKISKYDSIIGTYSVRGSRTVYYGQADIHGDNVYLHLDYRADKKIDTSSSAKAFTCAYGDSKYVNMGWQYLIRYNKKKNTITLAPNDVMAAAIIPHSFETREATYNPRTKEFSFRTRFTSPDDNNEVEIFEVLTAE